MSRRQGERWEVGTVEWTSGREALTVVADFNLTIVYYRVRYWNYKSHYDVY
jgi:hypothetical protein